jgi:hypothetical protein
MDMVVTRRRKRRETMDMIHCLWIRALERMELIMRWREKPSEAKDLRLKCS